MFSDLQQVPDEIDRVMVGIEAYFSIRRHVFDTGFAAFEDICENDGVQNEKVQRVFLSMLYLSAWGSSFHFRRESLIMLKHGDRHQKCILEYICNANSKRKKKRKKTKKELGKQRIIE